MKPSEGATDTNLVELQDQTLPYPRSQLADPPISIAEAKAARDANCHRHGGFTPDSVDRDGDTLFCPVGRQYWRYTKGEEAMYGRLSYPRLGVV